jgi:thiol:disulfide interchange protein DsbC
MRFTLCLILVAFFGIQPALAEDPAGDPADQLSQILPNTTIDGFGPTPIPGLFEVTAGDQIFYFSPTGHLVFGEIWTKDGRSLTAERREQVIAEKIKRLPLQKALTIGNGPHQVIEFTDPDCPFCRKVDVFFANRSDVTRHVFFYPIAGLHPKAAAKARYILCSDDRERAMREVYAGAWDSEALPPLANGCQETLLDEHLQLGGMLGVRGTPTIWVDGTAIKGADLAAIAALLDQPSKQ